jgi:hypothetical protein
VFRRKNWIADSTKPAAGTFFVLIRQRRQMHREIYFIAYTLFVRSALNNVCVYAASL